jgi:hypothetical protein
MRVRMVEEQVKLRDIGNGNRGGLLLIPREED